jgi:hypothetical protein
MKKIVSSGLPHIADVSLAVCGTLIDGLLVQLQLRHATCCNAASLQRLHCGVVTQLQISCQGKIAR